MIRLLKMIVQPILVDDDGETLKEVQVEPLVVSAEEWAEFSTQGWETALKRLEEQLRATHDPTPPS